MPEALSWLPEWMWSYNFPNNVNGVYGPQPAGYTGKLITEADPWPIFEGFGTYLSPGVYPTAFYETLMAFAIFGVLWSIRMRLKVPGMLFALYLFLNGMERFWIEKIRVNVKMDFLGLQITQAELIASLMMLAGAALFWIHKKRAQGPAH
jgi:prolipoprotein diacylglyceryltransferase